jgi:hypothetical protein
LASADNAREHSIRNSTDLDPEHLTVFDQFRAILINRTLDNPEGLSNVFGRQAVHAHRRCGGREHHQELGRIT